MYGFSVLNLAHESFNQNKGINMYMEIMNANELCRRCTGADGKLKKTYDSRFDAQETADSLAVTEEVKLRVYECPAQRGWHLTKQQSAW